MTYLVFRHGFRGKMTLFYSRTYADVYHDPSPLMTPPEGTHHWDP